MPCEIIERMAACDDCRKFAVDYGLALISSRRHYANPRDWEMDLTVTRIDLDNHLIAVHGAWLPVRQPDCDVCELWREDYAVGPMDETEALHRAWHLCQPLREICTPGNHELTHLM